MNQLLFYILIFVVMGIGALVQIRLKSKFKEYSDQRLASGLTGREVAEKMLRDSGIYDVRITNTPGSLTDHYNPANKTINLSEEVYATNSVAAAAVAAHETGHAIQHAMGYAPLRLRSALVPVVNFAGLTVQWVLLGGILLINIFPSLLLFGIILFALTTLFSFITLPVEIDASGRALAWLERSGITSSAQQPMAASALRTAAYTYVAAALGSLVTLLYYVSIYSGRR
ncbi:MAG: zinc metallopeptidase [Porphyromonas sp.]|nr:zinc metallopeptidase [Bacteroidales bacterium]MDD7558657.1 zinc metallopeptidase [Bacteroidales bacterium]MDY3099736.1 zinc metallopeptidase [Porphyromonas sp.]